MQRDQLYVTHCLPADSVSGRPGFEVRAASTADAELLQFAASYPAYELPMDLRRPGQAPADAPCRLALVAAPDNRAALVRTVYVAEDTCGRKNSFFSHVLIGPPPSLEQALSAWDSPDWKQDYPGGANKSLPPFTGSPRPGPLNDAALAAFLSGNPSIAGERLPPEARRQLLRRTMQGVRLVLRAGEDEPRGRLSLLAEPALTALLLYGAARLLPEARGVFVPFSTYENAHRVLREYRLGKIVGTWLAEPERGLPEDCYHARGYALDTFSLRASPELDLEVPASFDEAIDMAVRGEWDELRLAFAYAGGSSPPALRPILETLHGLKRLTPDAALTVLRLAHGTAPARLVTAFELHHPPPATDDELKRTLAAWLRATDGCPAAEQNAAHRLFLERVVPVPQRERVERALLKKGLIDEPGPKPVQRTPEEDNVERSLVPRRGLLVVTHLLAFTAGLVLCWLFARLLTPP